LKKNGNIECFSFGIFKDEIIITDADEESGGLYPYNPMEEGAYKRI
jgi:hypothetical protein